MEGKGRGKEREGRGREREERRKRRGFLDPRLPHSWRRHCSIFLFLAQVDNSLCHFPGRGNLEFPRGGAIPPAGADLFKSTGNVRI